jgi:cytochrome c556
MKRIVPSLALATLLAAAGPGIAIAQQGPSPEDEIHYRQSVMTVIGRAMGTLGAMAQGKAPFNAAVAQKNADLLDTMMELPWKSFGPGTDWGKPTRAAPKVFSDAAGFGKSADAARKAVADLAKAAKSGNEGQFKSAFGAVGKSCKSCHDDYRLKEARS